MFLSATLLPIVVVTLGHPLSHLLKVGTRSLLFSWLTYSHYICIFYFTSAKGGFLTVGGSVCLSAKQCKNL